MHEDRRCISQGLLYPLISFVIVFAFASICVVLIFHPNERHDIDTITQSRIFQDTVLVAAVIGLPMGADVFLDCFAFSRSTVPERIHLVTRILLLLSLTLPSFYLYVAVLLDNLSAASYASVLALTNVTSRGCVCIFLSLHDKKIGSGPICISISFCYAITESMRLLLFLHNHDLEAFEHTLLTFMTFIWLQLLYLFFKWWTTEKSSEDFFIVAYLLCLSAMTLEYVLMLFGLENIGEITLNPFKVSASMYSQIAFIVICMTVSGRASRSSLQKCADTMEERQAFVRYISHELRTPMNAVFLGITFIKDEIRSIPPALTEYIGHIYETVDDVNNCCEVAISILNDLLTFDKLEEGKMTVEFEETPIKDYVTDVVKPFRVEARQKNIEILVNINGDESGWEILAAIQVDRHKMSQVIRNLLSNAIKFTPPDGKVTVNMTRVNRQNPYSSFTPKTINILRFLKGKTCSVSPHTQDSRHFAAEDSIDYLRIEVIDTGAGISPENQKKLFGQYVQFDAGKLQKGSGSGLGLWISKGIVSLHGG